MASRWPDAKRAAGAAGPLTAHALFWEVLRAVRGDYWSGWNAHEAFGAAAGAATGAVAAKMTEKYDTCLPMGAPMRMTLSNALVL